MLFLIAIVLGDLGLEQDAIRFVFGFNINSRDFLFKRKEKYKDEVSSANEESERSGCGFAIRWRVCHHGSNVRCTTCTRVLSYASVRIIRER